MTQPFDTAIGTFLKDNHAICLCAFSPRSLKPVSQVAISSLANLVSRFFKLARNYKGEEGGDNLGTDTKNREKCEKSPRKSSYALAHTATILRHFLTLNIVFIAIGKLPRTFPAID